MKIEIEQYLWNKIGNAGEHPIVFPRDIIGTMLKDGIIQSPKQAWRTLEKWCRKGLYTYGVCLDLGWRVDFPIKCI